MIEDKKVGKLWQNAIAYNSGFGWEAETVKDLIRKLVEERAKNYAAKCRHPDMLVCQHIALAQFGIDPKDFQ